MVGHTTRAITTIEQYLSLVSADQDGERTSQLLDPVAYYLVALGDPEDSKLRALTDAAIAERGIIAGQQLGDQPASTVLLSLTRVLGLLERCSGNEVLNTFAGAIRLVDYLPTRSFELVVHSLDLARATGIRLPEKVYRQLDVALDIAVGVAKRRGAGFELLLVLTGRQDSVSRKAVL